MRRPNTNIGAPVVAIDPNGPTPTYSLAGTDADLVRYRLPDQHGPTAYLGGPGLRDQEPTYPSKPSRLPIWVGCPTPLT